jgi:hypothetical protein
MFKYRRIVLGAFALTLGLALILVWAAGPGARAQDEAPAANLPPLEPRAPLEPKAPLKPKAPLEPKAPLGTAFTYQGQLSADSVPATGPCDFRFSLFDAASDGAQVGSTLTQTDVPLSDGRFVVNLDFGVGVFDGDARWLEIAVQCTGDSAYTTLGRTALKAAPYALYATGAPWSGLQGVPADLADGDDDTTYSAGTGLSLSGTQFSANTGYLQRRVGDSCSAGNAISAISSTGTVKCESIAGRNDHDHWGQTWSGSSAGMTLAITGIHTVTVPGIWAAVLAQSADWAGVWGKSGSNIGVYGSSTNGTGVHGLSNNNFGLVAEGDDSTFWDDVGDLKLVGEYGEIFAAGQFMDLFSNGNIYFDLDWDDNETAARFSIFSDGLRVLDLDEAGNLDIDGSLTKGGGGFKIDHPLDPENKYLYHSFVESPDMMNVYNGNAVLEANGEAWVELPDWFEALNEEFRYQLTCIGGYAPVYIAQEVVDNRFQIAGGTPGLKVSWQVTGIRHDAYAEANRLPVEEDKPPHEQGAYLHPAAYGLPESAGIPDPREVEE